MTFEALPKKRIFVKNPDAEKPEWVEDHKSWRGDSEWMFEVPAWATDDDIDGFIGIMKRYDDWSEAEDEEFDYWQKKDRDHGDGRYH